MDEVIKESQSTELEQFQKPEADHDLMWLTEELFLDNRDIIEGKHYISVPIAGLASLGAGVSSMIPAFNTVTQTIKIDTKGLYRLANAEVGDALKAAKDGNFWGSLKTAEGKSKFTKWQEAGPLTGSAKTVQAFNPATMMMAAALYSIEKDLGTITDMARQILSFLEMEKESEIEADLQTLIDIIRKYKYNWDNNHFVSSNHKMVLDIKRTARKNINMYQKKIIGDLASNKFVVAQNMVSSALENLEKEFKYYRLSLHTFAFASLLEIMLSGNFKEGYISSVKTELRLMAESYRNHFEDGSKYLEKLSESSIESNILKGVGGTGKAAGKFIGSIPFVKEVPVGKLLRDGGTSLEDNAADMTTKTVKKFSSFRNPQVEVFAEKMNDMVQIYNHTSQICFDKDRIYLVGE